MYDSNRKLDRLGLDLAYLVNDFSKKDVTFCSLNDKIDTGTPADKLIFHIFCSLAEFERSQIRERKMAGLAATKIKVRVGGKPAGLSEDARKVARIAESLHMDGYAIRMISQQLKISRTTVYKYLEYRGVQIKK